MKKTIIITMAIILLISLVYAGIGAINKDKTVSLSPEAEQFYKNKGIVPSYKDYQEGDYYGRCLITNTEFNLPCSDRFKGTMNETKLDNWQIERLEGIAQKQIERENKPVKEII